MNRRVVTQIILTENEIFDTFTRVIGILESEKIKHNKTLFTATEFLQTCNRYYGFPRLSSSTEIAKISNLFLKFIKKYESQQISNKHYYSFNLKPNNPSIFDKAITIYKLISR